MDHVEKLQTLVYGRHLALFDRWVALIAAAMCMEDPCAQRWLIRKESRRLLVAGKRYLAPMRHSDIVHLRRIELRYFVIVSEPEKCMISAAPGNRKYVFYSHEENGRLFKIVKTEERKMPREYVFLKHGTM